MIEQVKAIVPRQRKGAQSATTYTVTAVNTASAQALFQKARKNLLNVNRWHFLAGHSSAIFQIITDHGEEAADCAKEGNYLRISIPAVPDSSAGDGYDWVKIEKIDEQDLADRQYIAMRVRPAVPPFYNKKEVAHFFTPDATSTFCIERKRRKVTAAVYGRNERPNTQVYDFLNKLRNILIALGAMMGLNKPQWKNLVKGLLNKT